MIEVLITLLILCLILGLAVWIVSILPLPHPFGLIAQVVIGVIGLIVLIELLLGGGTLATIHGLR